MAEKLKAKSWSSFVISSGGKKGKPSGDIPGDNFQPCYFMTLDGKHKYIRYIFPNRIEELYDVEKDPDELTNLSMDPAYQSRLAGMRGELIAYLKETGGAGFVDLLPVPKSAAEYLRGKTVSTTSKGRSGSGEATAAKLPGDTPVFSVGGKGRVHVEGCRRLSNDPAERAKMTKMTLAEAEANGLPLCSRCPGSNTQGKGNP
jgi:hypothetical protein